MAIQEIPAEGLQIDPRTGEPLNIQAAPEDRQEPVAQPSAVGIEQLRAMLAAAEAAQNAPVKAPPAPVETQRRGPGRPRSQPPADPGPEAGDPGPGPDQRSAPQTAAQAAPVQQAASAPVQAAPAVQAVSAPAVAAGTAVAGVEDPALIALMAKDAAKGLNFTADDLAIPRLYLLQDMSPQIKDRNPEFVPGARPGMWFNTVTRSVYGGFEAIPLKYLRRYVAWRPRNPDGSGGGLVRGDVPYAEYRTYEEIGIGVRGYRDDIGDVEVVETPEWIFWLVNAGNDPAMAVAVSFPKTKATAAGQINTLLSMQRGTFNGQEFDLPAYATVLLMGAKVTGEGAASYFIPNPSISGRVSDVRLFEKVRRLHDNFDRDGVDVAPAAAAEQG